MLALGVRPIENAILKAKLSFLIRLLNNAYTREVLEASQGQPRTALYLKRSILHELLEIVSGESNLHVEITTENLLNRTRERIVQLEEEFNAGQRDEEIEEIKRCLIEGTSERIENVEALLNPRLNISRRDYNLRSFFAAG